MTAAEDDGASEETGIAPERRLATGGSGGLDARRMAGLLGGGLLHFDASLIVDEADHRAHELLATAPGRLVGRSPMEAFLERRAETLLDAARSGVSTSAEVTLHDAGTRDVILHAWPDGSGGVWALLQDVSELRRLQRIRAEFVDNLAHELRTPLASISLLLETLAGEVGAAPGVPARVAERVERVRVETGHLAQIVEEMLDLSRIESGEAMLLDDVVDLGRLAREAAARMGAFAERQGVRLLVVTPSDAPRVRGNEGRLGQAVVNLVHNAVKFSPDGGEVTVRVERDGDEAEVSVEDHGIGIDQRHLPRIFERFYKVDRARARGGGTGLGLSIVRHIVEAHGGRVSVASRIGLGTTFTVRLPMISDGATAGPAD